MSETKKVLKSVYKSLEHVKDRINSKPEEIASYLDKHESERIKLNELMNQINQLIKVNTEKDNKQTVEIKDQDAGNEKQGHRRTRSQDHLLPEIIRHPSKIFHRRVKSDYAPLSVESINTITADNNEQPKYAAAPFIVEPLKVNPTNELLDDVPNLEKIASILDIKKSSPIEEPAILSSAKSPAEHNDNSTAEAVKIEQLSTELETTDKMSVEDNKQEEETNPENAHRKQQLTKFYGMLEELRKKRADFEKRYPKDNPHDKNKPYCAINELITTLNSHAKSYEKLKTNLSEFKDASSKLINEKRKGILGQHRGCKEILSNLLLFIGTLGIGYLLAAAITRSLNPIKVNTNSVEKINATAETINALMM